MGGQRIKSILKGVIGGAFIGLFLGVFAASLTVSYVIQKADFVHPTLFEMAESRYRWTLILSFLFVFALVGLFFAVARVYGIPLAFVIGPIAGILIGDYQRKRAKIENKQ